MTNQNANPFGVNVVRRRIAPPAELKAGLLVVPARVAAEELQLHCQMYRDSARDYSGAYEVLFEDFLEDGAPDESAWFNAPPGHVSQAAKWKALMDWPIEPDFETASQWQSAATAEAYNALITRVMTFRAHVAECTRLATADPAFWRSKMPRPPDRVGPASIAEIAAWLLEVAPTTLAAWREQLEAEQVY
jgi:hypothetical protein